MERNKAQNTQEALTRFKREDLRNLLTAELAKDRNDIDDSLVRQLLGELETRGKDLSFADDETVESACEKFQLDMEKNSPKRKRWYQRWMLKVASVVLVLGILFFVLPGFAQADDIQGVLTWWSDSVFQFFKPGEQPLMQEYVYETDHPGLQKIYDAVTELGVTDPVVPRWMPNGFELISLDVFQLSSDVTFFASMDNGSESILLSVTIHNEDVLLQHEKDKQDMEIWDLAGREHYVISNLDEVIVTWVVDKIECVIITGCPKEEVYKIIKSIYISEG